MQQVSVSSEMAFCCYGVKKPTEQQRIDSLKKESLKLCKLQPAAGSLPRSASGRHKPGKLVDKSQITSSSCTAGFSYSSSAYYTPDASTTLSGSSYLQT